MTQSMPEVAYTNGYEFTQGSGYELPHYPFMVPPEITLGVVGRYPIVIVGGGLSGLTLACSLAQLGISAVLLDEDNTVGVKGASSRGICYTQKSLEIFDKLGVYERIASKGIQWSVGRTFAGSDEVYSFDLRQQGNFHLSTQPPFINIQQFYIEGYLVERIAELGMVNLRWSSRVVGFEQDDQLATLTVQTPAGNYRLQAEHVVDCTGSHTPFHAWTGVELHGRKGDDRWCIADVRFSKHPPVERHTWIEAPFNDNRAVWQHLMADDVWRIDYQMAPNADPVSVSREEVVRERLARQFGADAEVEVVWVGPYAYRSQYADRLRTGRVFFMGDTAKIVSPFGARGGNTGISDADNLAWKLAAVLRGQAPEAILDSYHEERHEAAVENVKVTARTARFLRAPEGVEQVFKKAAISLARQHAFARPLINTGRMALANPYAHSSLCSYRGRSNHAGIGTSCQNVRITWANGDSGTLNDLLEWAAGRHLLLVFGQMNNAAVQTLQQFSQVFPVRCVQVITPDMQPQVREFVVDIKGHLQATCHVFGHAWALVRPDSYLAATGESVGVDLLQAIEKSLGRRTRHKGASA